LERAGESRGILDGPPIGVAVIQSEKERVVTVGEGTGVKDLNGCHFVVLNAENVHSMRRTLEITPREEGEEEGGFEIGDRRLEIEGVICAFLQQTIGDEDIGEVEVETGTFDLMVLIKRESVGIEIERYDGVVDGVVTTAVNLLVREVVRDREIAADIRC
jgi:hypothetical protein